MKKGSSKCKSGGKASSKKSASVKKMADGGTPGKPNRNIFAIVGKRKVKTRYGSLTGQGRTTTLKKSEPSTTGGGASRIKKPTTPTKTTSKSVTRYKNVRFL